MEERERILVVDDEETLCEVVRFNLEKEGFEVATAYSAEEALAMDISSFSLILLDIMMGDISGRQMASILKKREDTASIPIIFCTAKDTDEDMVDGLEMGADDYITKPYSIRNVVARVKAVLRRVATSGKTVPADDETISADGLSVSLGSKVCMIDGVEVKMPRKEFEILTLLLRNRGRVFSRGEILDAIWPEEVVVVDRVVDVNITRLRSKLGEYSKMIVTKPGYGYVFVD